jgi:hypothetical protein
MLEEQEVVVRILLRPGRHPAVVVHTLLRLELYLLPDAAPDTTLAVVVRRVLAVVRKLLVQELE